MQTVRSDRGVHVPDVRRRVHVEDGSCDVIWFGAFCAQTSQSLTVIKTVDARKSSVLSMTG